MSQEFFFRNAVTESSFAPYVPRVVFIDDKPTTLSRAERSRADRGGVAIFANDRYKATVYPLISEVGCAIVTFKLPGKTHIEYQMGHF